MAEADSTKARLLEAAGEEFAEKGFARATVRSILDRASVGNIAAVNYYFGDKEQLYCQAVLEAHRCRMGEEPDADPYVPAAVQLRQFIHGFLSQVLAVGDWGSWQQRLMLREMLEPTTASEVLVRERIRPRFAKLLGILQRFCPEADERRLTALAFSVVGQCLHYRMGRPIAERLIGPERFASLDVNYLTDHITRFTLAALGEIPPLDASGVPGSPEVVHQEAGGRS